MVNTGRVDRGVGSEFLRVSLKFGSAATFDFLPTMHQIGENPPRAIASYLGLRWYRAKPRVATTLGTIKVRLGSLRSSNSNPIRLNCSIWKDAANAQYQCTE